MPSVSGRAAGFIAQLYYVAAPITTKNITNVAAAAITANEVRDVADMGTLSKERAIIDIPVYGADVMGKLPGQANPGTFDFNVTYDFANATHNALRDNPGTTEHTFIIRFTQGANVSYAVFDGYVANASVGLPIDDRIQMDCSVARSGAITWVNAA